MTMSYGAGGSRDFWLIKTNASGNEEWNKTFGSEGIEDAYSVAQTTDGGYILAGHVFSLVTANDDAWLIKTNGLGDEQWQRTFGAVGNDIAYSVAQTTDGGYILAGMTMSYGVGNEDAWLIKTDTLGNQQWMKTFGGANNDWAQSVHKTTDGGYIVAGGTCSFGDLKGDAWLIKTDASGNAP
jgi:hypothetical protein